MNQYITFMQFQHAEAQLRLHINDQVQETRIKQASHRTCLTQTIIPNS
jgi:hypothetical protein